MENIAGHWKLRDVVKEIVDKKEGQPLKKDLIYQIQAEIAERVKFKTTVEFDEEKNTVEGIVSGSMIFSITRKIIIDGIEY